MSTASTPYQLRTMTSVTTSSTSSSDSSRVTRCVASSAQAPTPTSGGVTYPAMAVMTIPGPLRLPRETVSPEVSACSRIPSSRRPDSSEAAAWPLSCAIVIAIRVIRQSSGLTTMSSATAALTPTTHTGGTLCAPISRSQNTATHKGYSLLKADASDAPTCRHSLGFPPEQVSM